MGNPITNRTTYKRGTAGISGWMLEFFKFRCNLSCRTHDAEV